MVGRQEREGLKVVGEVLVLWESDLQVFADVSQCYCFSGCGGGREGEVEVSWAGKGVLIHSKERKCAGGGWGSIGLVGVRFAVFAGLYKPGGGSGLYKAANLTLFPGEMKERGLSGKV